MTLDESVIFNQGGELGTRMRRFPWDASPIGPVSEWPVPLRTLVSVMLGSKQPMFTVWGEQHTLLFNDAYRAILGHAKDSDALGRSFLDVWSEARADLLPLVERAYAGESVHMDDITLMVDRDGTDPEAHFAFSYTPVRDRGRVAGFLCACSETTETVMAGRRQAVRLQLEQALLGMDDADLILRTAGQVLGGYLGVSRVGFGEVAPDGDTIELKSTYTAGVTALEGTFSVDLFGRAAAARLRRGETVAVADVEQEADADQALWRSVEARSYITAPIMRNAVLAATLFVNQSEARRWSAEDIALTRAVGTRVNDAVQRARAEEETRASNARFRTLTQAIPTHVWIAGTGGAIEWYNERAADYVGGTAVQLGSAGWGKLVHPDDRESATTRWERALAAGDVYEVEFRLRRADGAFRWHLVRGLPERDFGGTVIRWVGTNTDIDDQKRAELDLQAAKAAAEEANLAKSTFIANMSHELRTPLSAIIGYSEMMAEEIADGCSPDEVADDLAKVENNARHLLGLINDVLDLSKIESGKMEAFAEDFAVEPMLRDLATTVESLISKKGNTLALALAPDLGEAHTDLVKLRQMLLNLLSNAAKFTENGTVTLSASREADRMVFTVRDTGIGMNEEQLSRLFQRFTQADTSTTRKFGGTGLGLSLTRAFANLLGGEVTVHSREGDGSSFTLTLPARLETQAKDEVAEAVSPTPEPSRNLILVIDDDADQRTLMTRFLQREGFDVAVAVDGRTGLALARQLLPRAVLLDVLMPGIDGWSVLTQIKADPALTRIPVVMVTSVDQRSLAAQLGAAEYMLKPVQWDRFRTVMDRFRTQRGGVLLVEDDRETRAMIRTVMEDDGWTVTEAADGMEGLARAREQRPEVVLTDLNMPMMDGFDFLEQLRSVPGCADVPVVVLTARDLTREDRKRLRGASQILNKGDVSLRGLAERLYGLADKVAPAESDGVSAR